MQTSSLVPDVATTTTSAAAIQSSSNNTKKQKRRRSKKNTSDNAQDNDIKTSILNSNLSLKKHTQLKKLTKLTPWYDINELISVGRGLLLAVKLFPSPSSSSSIATPPFSSSTSQQPQELPQSQQSLVAGLTNKEYTQLKLALHTVAIWRGKSDKGGRLSHAIDITAGLASVLLMDAERSSAMSTCNSGSGCYEFTSTIIPTIYQMRSTYSTLLLRSVNGLADTYRHSSKSNQLSVSYCCKLAGLPLWIVDIRHDASHNDLPTLGVCRIGALESLKFWSRRYWKLLEGKCYGNADISVGSATGDSEDMEEKGIYTLAVDCLVRYQNAVVNEVCDQQQQNKMKGEKKKAIMGSPLQGLEAVGGKDNTGSTSSMSNEIDGKSNSDEKQVTSQTSTSTGSANPWSILNDDKPKKKRKKKKDDNDDTTSMLNKPVTTTKSQEDTKTSDTLPPASARDCAAEFIRTIPIDIAHSTVIQFLVWGRTSMNASEENNNVNGPALLTLPPVLDLQSSSSDSNKTQSSTSSQEFDTSFEQLRIMYEPLIIAITNVYPGFITALFVHLIDSILCLDKARRQSQQGDGDLDVNQLDRNSQYVLRWIRHILSRAFHMHFDKSVAIFIPKIDQSVVIKPPLQAETAAVATDTLLEQANEKIFTPQPIDLKKKGRKKWTQGQLEYMQRPLDYSSLQDMGFPLNSTCDRILSHHQELDSGTAVRELKQHLEDIIGNERVVFMGIYSSQEIASEDSDHGISGSTSSTRMLDNSKPPQEVPIEENNILSLEDMEDMLDTKDTATKKDNHDVQVESEEPENTLPSRVVPWTLCKSWDACAIGSLPGYPV